MATTKIYNPQTLVEAYNKKMIARDFINPHTDKRTPEERTLWAVAMCDARNFLNHASTKDMANLLIEGRAPITIEGWMVTVYADLIDHKMGGTNDVEVQEFFATITKVKQKEMDKFELDDLVQMLVEAVTN